VLEDFSDGVANSYTPQTGTWTTTSGTTGRYSATPPSNDAAISVRPLAVAPLSYVEYSATVNAAKNGTYAGLTFAQTSSNDFLYAAVVAGTNQVVLGHRSYGNWYVDAVTTATVTAGADYSLLVALSEGVTNTVNVVLNGKSVLSYNYNYLVHDGGVGLFARSGSASFDNVLLRGDDFAYAGGGTPQTADAPATQATSAGTVNSAELGQLVGAAKQLWTNALGAGDPRLTVLNQVNVLVGDLPGNLLGSTTGTTVVLDSDAAGWGWFVDRTPMENSEFATEVATGVFAAQPGSPAYGHMDLLSTLLHEFGNAMGFAEDQGQDVTGATLQAGVRRLPAPQPTVISVSSSTIVIPEAVQQVVFGQETSNGSAAQATGKSGASVGLPVVTALGTAPSNDLAVRSNAETDPPQTFGLTGSLGSSAATVLEKAFDFLAPASLGTSNPLAVVPNSELIIPNHGSRTLTETPKIKWEAATDQRSSSEPDGSAPEWLDDFLNHIGKDKIQRNPNSELRIRL
jgi:hypothetical protein